MTTADRVRALLAEVSGLPFADVAALPDDTPLLDGGLALTSLRGATLLVRVRDELGVDVAAEDLALDALESIGSLTAFVAARRA